MSNPSAGPGPNLRLPGSEPAVVSRPDLLDTDTYSPPRVLRRNRLLIRRIALYLVVTAVAGVVSGLIWHATVHLPGYTVGEGGSATTTERQITQFFGTDAAFSAIGIVVGLALGLLAWRWFHRVGWPVAVLAGLGGNVAALIAWHLGELMGPSDFSARVSKAVQGEFVPIDFSLQSHSAVLLWMLFAVVPVLLISSLGHDEDEGPRRPRRYRVPPLGRQRVALTPASAVSPVSAPDGSERPAGEGD